MNPTHTTQQNKQSTMDKQTSFLSSLFEIELLKMSAASIK